MTGAGEPGHVGAGLGDDHVGDAGRDAWDRDDQVPGTTKGFDHHLDPPGELVDRPGVAVDQVEMTPGQEPVVLAEAASQRLGQLGDLRTQTPLGQIRQRGRVAFPSDQRFEHGPAGHPADVAGHRGQFDTGVLEQLLQPLDLPAALPGDRGAGPGQVPKLADRLGRHERPSDQTMRAELRQPGGVTDIGLASWQVLHVPGVNQHHLEGAVFEEVVERLPVVAGCLHHHQCHLLG